MIAGGAGVTPRPCHRRPGRVTMLHRNEGWNAMRHRQRRATEGWHGQDHSGAAGRRMAAHGATDRDARHRSPGEPVRLVQHPTPPPRRGRRRPAGPGPVQLAARQRARTVARRVRPDPGRQPAACRERCPSGDPEGGPGADAVPAERPRRLGLGGDPRAGADSAHRGAARAQPGAAARARGRAEAAEIAGLRWPLAAALLGNRQVDRRRARSRRERARTPRGPRRSPP
jgi:hypothetical protein